MRRRLTHIPYPYYVWLTPATFSAEPGQVTICPGGMTHPNLSPIRESTKPCAIACTLPYRYTLSSMAQRSSMRFFGRPEIPVALSNQISGLARKLL